MPKKKTQSDLNQNRSQERTVFNTGDEETANNLHALQQIKELQSMTPDELLRFLRNFGTLYVNDDSNDS